MRGDLQDTKHEIAILLTSVVFLEALTAVDAEKGLTADQATPGPASVFEGEKFVKTGQGFPVVEVVGVRSVYASDAQYAKVAVHEVQIMWTHVGDDELTTTAQLERLVRATRDVFWPHDGAISLPGANSAPVEVVSEEYSQLMPASGHPFVKGAVTMLRVPTFVV